MKYICSNCGEEHEDWPALTFISPHFYHILDNEQKKELGELDSDFCTITHSRVDRFIRVVLKPKVNNHCNDLEYGLWVSLSEKSFNDYSDNYNNTSHEVGYFGYLSNNIPGYPSTLSIHMDVFTQPGNSRPIIVPHEDYDHPFVSDYYNGISKQEAESRIKAMLGEVE